MLTTCENSLIGVRDRALLLLAHETARGRSELVALMVEGVIKSERRVTGLWLRRSTTDQLGTEKGPPISETAANAIKAWIG